MRVTALSLASINLSSPENYRSDIIALLKKSRADLAVLPAYSSLLLGISAGVIPTAESFIKTLKIYMDSCLTWNDTYLDLHGRIARELGIYLVAGTVIEREMDSLYHTAYCFNPQGETCLRQKQTHLTPFQRSAGLSRGEELPLFDLPPFKVGILIDNDARHPETGRILGLQGADIVIHCGALPEGPNCWRQAAGMWSQVQQNQFWAVEAQLSGNLAGEKFGAGPAVIGPCEITPGKSGYLQRGYPHTTEVTADLDQAARRELIKKYPLLKLLNPPAYSEIYREGS